MNLSFQFPRAFRNRARCGKSLEIKYITLAISQLISAQSSIKSKSSNGSQFSLLVNVRFLQCNQRESSAIKSIPRVQSSQSSPASPDFYRQTNQLLFDAEFNDFKSQGESPSKFSLKLGSKNQLYQPAGLRISYPTTTITKITMKTQVATFALLDSINHQTNCNSG